MRGPTWSLICTFIYIRCLSQPTFFSLLSNLFWRETDCLIDEKSAHFPRFPRLGFEGKKIRNTRGLTEWGHCVGKLPQHIHFFFSCKMGTTSPPPPPLFFSSLRCCCSMHNSDFYFHVRARRTAEVCTQPPLFSPFFWLQKRQKGFVQAKAQRDGHVTAAPFQPTCLNGRAHARASE